MANIVHIENIDDWLVREFVSASKLNNQVIFKMDSVYQNQVIINSAISTSITTSGPLQTKMPWVIETAPTGWSRDASFLTDYLLRVSDGVVPPGLNPTAVGGAMGGDATISGNAIGVAGAHTHTDYHTHSTNHTHSIPDHSHTIDHSHSSISHTHGVSTYSGNTSSFSDANLVYWYDSGFTTIDSGNHYHDASHNHTCSTDSASISSYSGISGSATGTTDMGASVIATSSQLVTITSSALNHAHPINDMGNWRPRYLNVLICQKD
jgi:hypothetical protein